MLHHFRLTKHTKHEYDDFPELRRVMSPLTMRLDKTHDIPPNGVTG